MSYCLPIAQVLLIYYLGSVGIRMNGTMRLIIGGETKAPSLIKAGYILSSSYGYFPLNSTS